MEEINNQEVRKIDLTDFQKNTINHIVEYYEKHNVYLLADETGLGKTIIASEVIRKLAENKDIKNVLYIASNLELAKENVEKLKFDRANVVKGRLPMLWQQFEKKAKNKDEDNKINLFALTPEVSLKMNTDGEKKEREVCEKKFGELKLIGEPVENEQQEELSNSIFSLCAGLNGLYSLLPNPKLHSIYYVVFNTYKKKKWRYLFGYDGTIGTYGDVKFTYDIEKDMEILTKMLVSIYLEEDVYQHMVFIKEPRQVDLILRLGKIRESIEGIFPKNSIGKRYIGILWDGDKDSIDNNGYDIPREMVDKIAKAMEDNWADIYEELKSNDELRKKIANCLREMYADHYYKNIRIYMAYYSLVNYVKPDIVIIDEIQNYPEIFSPESKGDAESETVKMILDTVLGKDKDNQPKVLMLSATPYAYRNAIEMDDVSADELETFSKHLVGMDSILDYMKKCNDVDCDIIGLWKRTQKLMNELVEDMEKGRKLSKYEDAKNSIKSLTAQMKKLGISRNERPCKSYKPTEGKYTLGIDKISVVELANYYVKGKTVFGNRLAMSLPRMGAGNYLIGYDSFEKYEHICPKDQSVSNGNIGGSARINAMLEDMFEGNAAFFLFMPPNYPSKELKGIYAGTKERSYGKTILFSGYNAVPKALEDKVNNEFDRILCERAIYDSKDIKVSMPEGIGYKKWDSKEGYKECCENMWKNSESSCEDDKKDRPFLGVTTSNLEDENTINGYCKKHVDSEGLKEVLSSVFSTLHAIKVILCLYGQNAAKSPDNYWKCVDQSCIDGNFYAVMEEFEYMISVQKKKETICNRLIGGENNCFAVSHSSKSNMGLFEDKVKKFNNPFYPFVFLLTSVAQEGHDFHWYSDRIIHWNVPLTPIALIQREGRIDRADCMSIRKAVAGKMLKKNKENIHESKDGEEKGTSSKDENIWKVLMSDYILDEDCIDENIKQMIPKFITGNHENAIMRMCYYYPLSDECFRWEILMKNLEYYRSMFGACENIEIERIKGLLEENDDNKADWKRLKELKLDLSISKSSETEQQKQLCTPSLGGTGEGDNMYDKQCMKNRELSWLDFNERVLNEAGNPRVPLAERLTFASIFQSNLDEFYMVRVGTLMVQMHSKEIIRENKTDMTSEEQVKAILKRTAKLEEKKAKIYEQLMGELEPKKIRIINFNKLSAQEGKILESYFDAHVAPFLFPMIVSRQQPFPFLENKALYAVVMLNTKGKKKKMGIVPCTNSVFQRLIEIPTRPGTFMLSEELILHFVSKMFPKYDIAEKSLMRITRNADIDMTDVYDEDLDYRDLMERLIKRRRKLSPVRLELSRKLSKKAVEELCEYLGLNSGHVFMQATPLDLKFVFQLQGYLRDEKGLFYEKRTPRLSPTLDIKKNICEQIRRKDVLLSYPFESIKPFITMLNQAAEDDDVVSIKMTLYRVADRSKIVEALIEAAENGKEVIVLVELRARFDEENNIEMSRKLEDAGCHVIYGLGDYKVHSKLCLITRRNENGFDYITQIGTGNYNEKTAELYTDLCLMTANQDIGMEADKVFKMLLLGDTVDRVNHLLVAPNCLQSKVVEMIDTEIAHAKAGECAYIGLKLNSLTDKVIIEKLIEASQAGVKVDMIIRGICCLKAKVPGLTDNITVVSVVGRFLEHSRIYRFGCGNEEKIYISSADFMTRNTVRRVEVATPIYDEDIRNRIKHIFDTIMLDDEKGKEQNGNGEYVDREINEVKLNSQEVFYKEAYDVVS